MSGIRAKKKRETRSAIIEAAIRLFGEKGFEGTSVEDLAREAGVGKGTIYGYFQNKNEIFLAFCEEELEITYGALHEEIDPEARLLDRLVALFMRQFRFVTENREFGRILIREMAFPPETTSGKSRELDASFLEAVAKILLKAQGRGDLKIGLDTFLAPVHFYALYLVALSGWYNGYVENYMEVEMSLRGLFRQALEGMMPPGGEITVLGESA